MSQTWFQRLIAPVLPLWQSNFVCTRVSKTPWCLLCIPSCSCFARWVAMSSLRTEEHEASSPAQIKRIFLRSLPWKPGRRDTQLASNGSKYGRALRAAITIKPISFHWGWENKRRSSLQWRWARRLPTLKGNQTADWRMLSSEKNVRMNIFRNRGFLKVSSRVLISQDIRVWLGQVPIPWQVRGRGKQDLPWANLEEIRSDVICWLLAFLSSHTLACY